MRYLPHENVPPVSFNLDRNPDVFEGEEDDKRGIHNAYTNMRGALFNLLYLISIAWSHYSRIPVNFFYQDSSFGIPSKEKVAAGKAGFRLVHLCLIIFFLSGSKTTLDYFSDLIDNHRVYVAIVDF